MGGTLLVNGTLTLNGHIFNYNSADIGVRGSGTVQSTSTYSYNMNSPSSGTTLTPAFEPTITGLNLVFRNNGNPAAYETFKIGNDISVKSIATPSGTTVSGLIVDMNGKAVTATNIYINKMPPSPIRGL